LSSTSDKPKKKRNKQRRRGSGRARRASGSRYIVLEGLDVMPLQFAGLSVLPDASLALPISGDVSSGFSKSGPYSPLSHYSPRHRGPPFWNQIPMYGQAY